MSSYIVDNKTIDRVLTGLKQSKILNNFKDLVILDYSAFGQELVDMNVSAVDQRYNETNDKIQYEFKEVSVTMVQAFKSLNGFLYQCAEGDVPEHPLYKQMREIEGAMARKIVCETNEYDNAEWA